MKNGKSIDWESRLARLESEVKELKILLQTQPAPKSPWWKSMVGVFANDPAADEVRKIIEESREKERRKARRSPAKQKK